MQKKSIRDVDVQGKRVFCRVDFNVPLRDGKPADETRLVAALPTIEYLLSNGAAVILASHLGRPKGRVVEEYRLRPVGKRLAEKMKLPVRILSEVMSDHVKEVCRQLRPGEVVLLENMRFCPEEEANDPAFAKELASLADLYVNDAFGAAHRAHASTEGMAHYLPSVAGLLMLQELDVLGNALENPQHPFTGLIGGSKVKDKIGVIDHLLDRVDHLLLGGGLANTFFRAKGYDVGNSLYEEDCVEMAQRFMRLAQERGVTLDVPEDVVVAEELKPDAQTRIVAASAIPPGHLALDIGPRTAARYAEVIRSSKLVIWNGPMGVFEQPPFATGTFSVAKAMTQVPGISIVGGGDSAAAMEQAGLAKQVTHISTGGGASLELLEGKVLPGIAVLQDK